MMQGCVIQRANELNERYNLNNFFSVKFETGTTKFETNTNDLNPKFKTKTVFQSSSVYRVTISNVLII